MKYLPSSVDGWRTILAVWLGGLLGWLMSPAVWLVALPGRWAAVLAMTARKESSFVSDAQGDGGRSWGPLQFIDNTWEALTDFAPEKRFSGIYSGYVAARYVQGAILTDARWLLLLLPVVGMGLFRVLWTRGAGAWDNLGFMGVMADALEHVTRVWPDILIWRGLTLLPLLPAYKAGWFAKATRRGRR